MIIEHQFDPFGKFGHYANQDMNNILGFLPGWVANPEYFEFPLVEALDKQYCCGMNDTPEVTITEDGIYKFPGDQDLHPILVMKRGTETFYQYEYGLVAIVQEDGTSYATRMD